MVSIHFFLFEKKMKKTITTRGELCDHFNNIDTTQEYHCLSLGGSVLPGELPEMCGMTIDGQLLSLPINDVTLFDKIGSKISPHGQGEKTVVDLNIRSSLEIEPSRVKFTHPDWDEFDIFIDIIGQKMVGKRCKVKAVPYKALFYRPGDHFVIHRDTEKEAGMFGTFVLHIPTVYKGGAMKVHHLKSIETYDFAETSKFGLHYTAHYSSLEHEIAPITEGCRLVMVYNLVWFEHAEDFLLPRVPSEYVPYIDASVSVVAKAESGMYAIPLDHQYTYSGLTHYSQLIGEDYGRALALVQGTANMPNINLFVVFCEVAQEAQGRTEHEGHFDEIRRYMQWMDFHGKHYHFPAVRLDFDEAEHKRPRNDEKYTYDKSAHFTLEDLECESDGFWRDPEVTGELAYTGNEGTTKETTYKRAAIVVWKDGMTVGAMEQFFPDRDLLEILLSYSETDPRVTKDVREFVNRTHLCPMFVLNRCILYHNDEMVREMSSKCKDHGKDADESTVRMFFRYVVDHPDLIPALNDLLSVAESYFRVNLDDYAFISEKNFHKKPVITDRMLWSLVNTSRVPPKSVPRVMKQLGLEWYGDFERYYSDDLADVLILVHKDPYFKEIKWKLYSVYVSPSKYYYTHKKDARVLYVFEHDIPRELLIKTLNSLFNNSSQKDWTFIFLDSIWKFANHPQLDIVVEYFKQKKKDSIFLQGWTTFGQKVSSRSSLAEAKTRNLKEFFYYCFDKYLKTE